MMTEQTETQTLHVPINDLDIDDHFNSRGALVPIDVEDLAKDIQSNGLHQPVVIMPYNIDEMAIKGKKFKLLAGFRRTYAHIILKKTHVLAVVKQHMNDIDARLLNLSENLKRKDLNILQEANALKALWEAGVPRDDVAARIGMSSSWVQARWAVLALPPDVQKIAASGLINQYQMKKLAGIKDKDKLYSTVREIKTRLEKSQNIDDIIKRKPPSKTEKRKRQSIEIGVMRDYILDQIGSNNFTRALAWAAGDASDLDLQEAVREVNKDFNLPKEAPDA